MELDWVTAEQAADKWGITARRVQALCVNGQVDGARRLGRAWIIPKDAPKPIDGRCKNGRKPTKPEQE